jgi:hypothetical protein
MTAATYANLADAKALLNETTVNAGRDALIQQMCDRWNGWMESKLQRSVAPGTLIATTVTSGGGAGSSAVTVGSATGIAAGDALGFGTVSGTHEHATVAAVAGNVVTLQSPLVATYGGGSAISRVLLWDGFNALEGGRLLEVPNGIIAMTALECAFYTGGPYSVIPTTDWFLRPLPMDREPGWPATELWMTDIPSTSNACPTFQPGRETVRAWGAQPGWPAMPVEIVQIALRLVVNNYRTRGSTGGISVAVGQDGERVIQRTLDDVDYRTIQRYAAKDVVII